MRKTNRKKKGSRPPQRTAGTPEQEIEFFTVGWSLSVLTALVCEISALAAGLASRIWPDVQPISAFGGLMLFAAQVAGVLSVVLLAIVWRGRSDRPPQSLVVASIVIALLAPALIFIRSARLL